MKHLLYTAALLIVMAGCTKQQNTNNINTNNNMKQQITEVAGRKNFGSKHPVITPLPCIMIATWDEQKNPDVMMAAWGGQCDMNQIQFELSAHKTTDNIRLNKAFTISFADKNTVVESDYFGTVSANKVPDKVAHAGFTVTPSPNVNAPIINEYPLTLECVAVEIQENEDGGARVIGQVVNWSADEKILTEDGTIDIMKLQPIIYNSANNTYHVVGEEVGKAWGSGKVLL